MQRKGLCRAAMLTRVVVAGLAGGGALAHTPARAATAPCIASAATPSAQFDAVNASDAELRIFGFPPRPDAARNPTGFANWATALRARPTRLVPQLVETVIHHGPRISEARALNEPFAASTNWSGFVAITGAAKWESNSFTTVAGNFIVPAVLARTCNGNWEYGSIWAGIDGNTSSDVLQAGIEADVLCSKGTTTPYYAPWYEWYPNAEVRITNLATTAGVSFYVKVWATSATAGHAYLQNLSTKQAVSLNFSAPSGTRLRGESAEWVVETPMVGSTLSTLPIYGLDYLSTAIAWNLNGVGHAAGGVGAFDVTLARSGTTFSTAGLLGTEGVQYTSH